MFCWISSWEAAPFSNILGRLYASLTSAGWLYGLYIDHLIGIRYLDTSHYNSTFSLHLHTVLPPQYPNSFFGVVSIGAHLGTLEGLSIRGNLHMRGYKVSYWWSPVLFGGVFAYLPGGWQRLPYLGVLESSPLRVFAVWRSFNRLWKFLSVCLYIGLKPFPFLCRSLSFPPLFWGWDSYGGSSLASVLSFFTLRPFYAVEGLYWSRSGACDGEAVLSKLTYWHVSFPQ